MHAPETGVSERRLAALLLVLALLGYLGHALSFEWCLQDDAYISLRYARNLAQGQGLVFNPLERVEGFTNPLWTVGLALPFWLGISPERFLWGAGLATGLLAVFAAWRLARSLAPQAPLAAGAAACLVAALPSLVCESASGLESALFGASCALALSAWLDERRAPTLGAGRTPRVPCSAWILGAVVLTRPEGIALVGFLFLAEALAAWGGPGRGEPLDGPARRRARMLALRGACARALLPVAAFLAYLAFRVAYYGDWVPNTFHAKVGGGWDAFARGASYAGLYASRHWTVLALAAVGIIGAALRSRRPGTGLAICYPLFFCLYVIYVGGDFKPTFRFFSVPTVMFGAWAGLGLEWLAARARARTRVRLALVQVGLVLLACGAVWRSDDVVRRWAASRVEKLAQHRAAGSWLKRQFPAGTWLATPNAGVIPYFAELPTIDMLGLVDAHIARQPMPRMGTGTPGHEKGDGKYVLDRAPRVILFQSGRFPERAPSRKDAFKSVTTVGAMQVWKDPRFAAHYEWKSVELAEVGCWFGYFERRTGE